MLVRQISIGNLAGGKFFHQFRVLRGGKSVSDALRAEIKRAPDGFRTGIFTGMGSEVQSVIGGICVDLAKQLGRSFLLVAAETDGHDVSFPMASRDLEDLASGGRPELAHRIENP